MMWWTDYWPTPWMLFGPFMMTVLLVVGVVLAMLALRSWSPRHPGGHAIDILAERFARGEIDRAEFEERRKLLQR